MQLFASGLVQQGPENKGCCGFMPYHLNKELRRGKNIVSIIIYAFILVFRKLTYCSK